jgi:hypothetical protein
MIKSKREFLNKKRFYKLVFLLVLYFLVDVVNAQEQDTSNQNYYDVSNIGTIDTNSTNVFVSDYSVTPIQKFEDITIDVNKQLGVETLKVGTKYTVTATLQNPFQYDIVIKKTLASCMCVSVNLSNSIIQAGGSSSLSFVVFPTMAGPNSEIVKFAIAKKTEPQKPIIIVGDRAIKINFTAKEN